MAIKRYTTEELINICSEIFFDYLINSPVFYDKGELQNCIQKGWTPIDCIYNDYKEMVIENKQRQELYFEEIQKRIKEHDLQCAHILKQQLLILVEEENILTNMCREAQERRYKEAHRIPYTRTAIRIPLNKRINSYYDDFILEVLFYDDVCTLKGKYDIYRKCTTTEEKMRFLKENISITHMGLCLYRSNNMLPEAPLAIIGLLGNMDFNDSKVLEGRITLLPHKFSNFSDLRLFDLNEIKNNDLRQIMQTKIDMDKEDMQLTATEIIRGSEYKLFKYTSRIKNFYTNQNNVELYIRYACDSTGRVYYNLLNKENLKVSKYFKESKPITYIEAWWNITHLGANVHGKPVIAC